MSPSSGSTLLIWILIIAFCLCNILFFLPYSMKQILPLTLVVALCSSSAACPASRDINCQVIAWKIICPFSPYSVSPRQGTCWETNVCAGRIVLHLKFVIWHRSATRFCNLQGGMKTLHDEHFGCSPLCLIFFICSDHVWNQSYWSQEYHSSPLSAR